MLHPGSNLTLYKWRDEGSNHCVQEDTWYMLFNKACMCTFTFTFTHFTHTFDMFINIYKYISYISRFVDINGWFIGLQLSRQLSTAKQVLNLADLRGDPKVFQTLQACRMDPSMVGWSMEKSTNGRWWVYILLETNSENPWLLMIVGRCWLFSFHTFLLGMNHFFRCEVLVSGKPSHPKDG